MGPDAAFLLLIAGLLAVYCELLRPGLIVPGVLGAAAAFAGAYLLFREPLQAGGVALLGGGAVLLIAEIFAGPYLAAGLLGALAITVGFTDLLAGPRRIAPGLAIPVSALFGVVTAVLGGLAKRARRAKRQGFGRGLELPGTFRKGRRR